MALMSWSQPVHWPAATSGLPRWSSTNVTSGQSSASFVTSVIWWFRTQRSTVSPNWPASRTASTNGACRAEPFGFVLNELAYPRHPRLVTESFKRGVDRGRAAVEGHTGHQCLDPSIALAKVLDPRGLLVHHVPDGVGLDEDQGFDLDLAHVEVCGDEWAVQLAEALEPGVVESVGVPEVDVAVHHGLCRCHESHSEARTMRSSTGCVRMWVSREHVARHSPVVPGPSDAL